MVTEGWELVDTPDYDKIYLSHLLHLVWQQQLFVALGKRTQNLSLHLLHCQSHATGSPH